MKSHYAVEVIGKLAIFALLIGPVNAICVGQSAGTSAPGVVTSQSAAASSASGSATSAAGFVYARLAKPLRSKKLQAGGVVEARIVSGGIEDLWGQKLRDIPRKSVAIGRVTEATARSKGDQASRLGIVFEKLRLHDGQELAIQGFIDGVYIEQHRIIAVPTGDYYHNPFPPCSPGDTQMTSVPCAGRTLDDPHPNVTQQSLPEANFPVSNLRCGRDGVVTSSAKEVELDSNMKLKLSLKIN